MKALSPEIAARIERLSLDAVARLGTHETVQEFANESDICQALICARSLTMGPHPDSDLICAVIAALLSKVEVTP